jgi:catechol 2,3-dioxygenase-like lactoylglutathione lyase family enzyme
MARIRHIALVAKDADAVATFYKSAFEMEEVFRHRSGETGDQEAIYLTDGYINLAILPIAHRLPEGIYHFGFQVDDVQAALEKAIACGAKPPPYALPRDGRQAETFVLDPLGVKVDLSPGWLTAVPAKT